MKKFLYGLLLFMPSIYCTEKYTPNIATPPTGFLVVEGIINSGTGPTNIYLSRSNQFQGQDVMYETSALVSVEGNDNSSIDLVEQDHGLYSATIGGLNDNTEYRLHVITHEGKEYLSDFALPKNTPAIDTIFWQTKDAGLQLYLDTHDEKNNTKYYQWDFAETWEIQSPFRSFYKWESIGPPPPNNDIIIVPAAADTTIYTCWKSDASTQIIIGSSAKLSSDIIHAMPIAFIPPGDEKLSVEYSIIIRQFALSVHAYDFLTRMKKNTEQTGSVFDPQPSELNGNMHCVTNPTEQVIGYISVASLQQKRIFIKANEVPGWDYRTTCREDTILDTIFERKAAHGKGLIPTRMAIPNVSYLGAQEACIDCTLRGTNVKPDFWPN